MNTHCNTPCAQRGFSMIEVLIALVILLVGLLGLAGLMVQSQRSEMEAYQRVQALVLLQDMANRINANRKAATCYQFTNSTTGAPYLGTASTLAASAVPATQCSSAAIQAIYPSMPAAAATISANTVVADMNTWHNALLGAAETVNTPANTKVGAMIGARGCISYDATQQLVDPVSLATIPGTGIYTISIAWQGLGDTYANTNIGFLCGQNQYGTEPKRRIVRTTLRIANLQ